MFEAIFIRSWWVIAFVLGCAILFERGMAKREVSYKQMEEILASLQTEKEEVLQERKMLKLQINSQSDPAWIELTLMKGLGLCPEGQTKVFFPDN